MSLLQPVVPDEVTIIVRTSALERLGAALIALRIAVSPLWRSAAIAVAALAGIAALAAVAGDVPWRLPAVVAVSAVVGVGVYLAISAAGWLPVHVWTRRTQALI